VQDAPLSPRYVDADPLLLQVSALLRIDSLVLAHFTLGVMTSALPALDGNSKARASLVTHFKFEVEAFGFK
jgi:hypothetical protein